MLTISGNAPSSVLSPRPGTSLGVSESQPTDDFLAQLTSRHGVDRGIDGFMRHLQCGHIWMHDGQCARNLLGRIAFSQTPHNTLPQRSSWLQPTFNARHDRADTGPLMGDFGTLATRHRWTPGTATRPQAHPTVSMKFTRNRRCRTTQSQGNCRWLDPHLQLCLNHRSLFNTQLLVDFSHATLSPKNVALGI